jgi:hypothetical protein
MRTAWIASFLLVAACASPVSVRGDETTLGAPIAEPSYLDLTPSTAPLGEVAPGGASTAALRLNALEPLDIASTGLLDLEAVTPLPALPRRELKVGDSYTLLRLGAFEPAGDTRDLDTGYWGEIAFGRCIAHFFSIEAVTGFYKLTGDLGAEVYGMPLLINGRVGIPIAIIEPYVGAGIGGIWAHTELNGLGEEDSFAGLWNAFLGVEVGLGGFAVGLDYKYLQTADLDVPGGFGDFNLEGHVLSLTGRLPF